MTLKGWGAMWGKVVGAALAIGLGLGVGGGPEGGVERIWGASERDAEKRVAAFRAANPEPSAPSTGAPQAEWNAYWREMHDWWSSVPWDAVAAQWGCEAGETSVELLESANGAVSAQYGGVANCSGELESFELGSVGIPEPRTARLAVYAMDAAQGASTFAVQQCDLPGGDNYCLTRPASGSPTLTASFQNGFNKTLTGRARLGSVPGTGSCVNGSQIALGTLGTGGLFATWYATGSAAYSGRFSSAFMAGSATYGRHCALM